VAPACTALRRTGEGGQWVAAIAVSTTMARVSAAIRRRREVTSRRPRRTEARAARSSGDAMARLRKALMMRAFAIPAAVASTRRSASATAVSSVADQVAGGQAVARPSPIATSRDPLPTNAQRWPTARKKATWAEPSSTLRAASEITARHTRLPIHTEAQRISTATTEALVVAVDVSPSCPRHLVTSGSKRYTLFPLAASRDKVHGK
jgi:hypothetical protein